MHRSSPLSYSDFWTQFLANKAISSIFRVYLDSAGFFCCKTLRIVFDSSAHMCSKGYSSWFVCLSVCVSMLILALQSVLLTIPAASELRGPYKIKRRFSWNDCVWDICHENKWKSKYSNRTGLPDPLTLCTVEAQEVTTKGMYQLPHAIYLCS